MTNHEGNLWFPKSSHKVAKGPAAEPPGGSTATLAPDHIRASRGVAVDTCLRATIRCTPCPSRGAFIFSPCLMTGRQWQGIESRVPYRLAPLPDQTPPRQSWSCPLPTLVEGSIMPAISLHTAARRKASTATNATAMPASMQAATLLLPETGFLRQSQLLAFVPFSKSTLWRRIQAKTFPQPIKLSERVTAWRAEDIRRWIAEQSG